MGNRLCPWREDIGTLDNRRQRKSHRAERRSVQRLSQMEIDFLTELLNDSKKEGGIQNTDDLEALAVFLISSTKGGLQYKRVLRDDFFSKILEQLKDLLK